MKNILKNTIKNSLNHITKQKLKVFYWLFLVVSHVKHRCYRFYHPLLPLSIHSIAMGRAKESELKMQFYA
jgi:hypothetical protein